MVDVSGKQPIRAKRQFSRKLVIVSGAITSVSSIFLVKLFIYLFDLSVLHT